MEANGLGGLIASYCTTEGDGLRAKLSAKLTVSLCVASFPRLIQISVDISERGTLMLMGHLGLTGI